MATRFYFSTTANDTGLTPSVDASWTGTCTNFDRYLLTDTASTAFSTQTNTQTMSSGQSYCVGQWISRPISNYASFADWDTYTGSCLMRWSESATAANYIYKYLWRLYGSGGSNVYRSWYTGATEFDAGNGATTNSVMESRRISSADWWAASTPSSAFTDLRFILEIGIQKSSGTSASHTVYCEIGGNSGTDLADNETGTSQFNPWFETSANVTLGSEPTSSGFKGLMMIGCGT